MISFPSSSVKEKLRRSIFEGDICHVSRITEVITMTNQVAPREDLFGCRIVVKIDLAQAGCIKVKPL